MEKGVEKPNSLPCREAIGCTSLCSKKALSPPLLHFSPCNFCGAQDQTQALCQTSKSSTHQPHSWLSPPLIISLSN